MNKALSALLLFAGLALAQRSSAEFVVEVTRGQDNAIPIAIVPFTAAEATEARLRGVFGWTRELGVPVLPLSAAEETAPQLRRLLGALPGRRGRGGGHSQTEATLG